MTFCLYRKQDKDKDIRDGMIEILEKKSKANGSADLQRVLPSQNQTYHPCPKFLNFFFPKNFKSG